MKAVSALLLLAAGLLPVTTQAAECSARQSREPDYHTWVQVTPELIAADGRSQSTLGIQLRQRWGSEPRAGKTVQVWVEGEARHKLTTDDKGRAAWTFTSRGTPGWIRINVSTDECARGATQAVYVREARVLPCTSGDTSLLINGRRCSFNLPKPLQNHPEWKSFATQVESNTGEALAEMFLEGRWRAIARELPTALFLPDDIVGGINAVRARLGLPAMIYHSALSAAARNHSAYLQQNAAQGNRQTRGQPAFTGETMHDRAQFTGAPFGATREGIAHSRNLLAAIASLMYAPVHRRQFLAPNEGEIGFCLEPECLGVVLTGGRLPQAAGKGAAMIYPPDGSVLYTYRERISEAALFGRELNGFAFLIRHPDNVLRATVSLTDEASGEPVPLVWPGDNANDRKLQSLRTAEFANAAPLQPGRSYRIDYSTARGEMLRSRFRTAE